MVVLGKWCWDSKMSFSLNLMTRLLHEVLCLLAKAFIIILLNTLNRENGLSIPSKCIKGGMGPIVILNCPFLLFELSTF